MFFFLRFYFFLNLIPLSTTFLLNFATCSMSPQRISGPGQNLLRYLIIKIFNDNKELLQCLKISTIVLPQNTSGPEHFSTPIARKGHSFQMMGFYVVFDSSYVAFFSAHFANICKYEALSDPVLTFFHH